MCDSNLTFKIFDFLVIHSGVDVSEFDPLSNPQPLTPATRSTNTGNPSHLIGSGGTAGNILARPTTRSRTIDRQREETPVSIAIRPIPKDSFFAASSRATIPRPSTPLFLREPVPPSNPLPQPLETAASRSTNTDNPSRLVDSGNTAGRSDARSPRRHIPPPITTELTTADNHQRRGRGEHESTRVSVATRPAPDDSFFDAPSPNATPRPLTPLFSREFLPPTNSQPLETQRFTNIPLPITTGPTTINGHQHRGRGEHEVISDSTSTRPISDASSPTTITIPLTPLFSRDAAPPNDLNKEEIRQILNRIKTDIDHISRLLT